MMWSSSAMPMSSSTSATMSRLTPQQQFFARNRLRDIVRLLVVAEHVDFDEEADDPIPDCPRGREILSRQPVRQPDEFGEAFQLFELRHAVLREVAGRLLDRPAERLDHHGQLRNLPFPKQRVRTGGGLRLG